MDFHSHDIPLPSKSSIILLASFGFFRILSHITKEDWQIWVSIAVGVCALISYGYKFIKWIKSNNAHHDTTKNHHRGEKPE